jgi:hypothetical protein
MAARKPIASSAVTGARRRKPEGREERVLYHVGLGASVVEDLDTLLWFQTQQYYRALRSESSRPPKPLKEDLIDAAVRAYLAAPRGKRPPLRVGSSTDVRLTFWLASSVGEEIEAIAVELGVPHARVLDAALTYFTQERLTDGAREFRRDTETRAGRFLERMFER